MKKPLITAAIFISALIAGLAGSLFTASGIVEMASEKIENDQESLGSLINQSYSEEFLLSLAIGNIELIKKNELNEFYRINCFLLESQLMEVRPEAITSKTRKERVVEKVNKARQLLASLENEGLCKAQSKS